jgi:hypothetical protein
VKTATHIRFVGAATSAPVEIAMNVDKQKKLKMPDLRHGVQGSVLVKDTDENFAGKAPDTAASGSEPVGPDVGVAAVGQTTHE